MERITLTSGIIKSLFEQIINKVGNTNITIKDKTKSIFDYAKLTLYTFDNRLGIDEKRECLKDQWLMLGRSFGLVEITDDEKLFSPDIDYSVVEGSLTFVIPSDKTPVFEQFWQLIRNETLGIAVEVKDSDNGNKVKGFLQISPVVTNELLAASELGQVDTLSSSFTFTYMSNPTNTYSDYNVSISWDGGNNYFDCPVSEFKYGYITSNLSFPMGNLKDAGTRNLTRSSSFSMTVYDFNAPLTDTLIYLALSCNLLSTKNDPINDITPSLNEEMLLKIARNGEEYVLYMNVNQIYISVKNQGYSVIDINFVGAAD